jgi:hypothetical protein
MMKSSSLVTWHFFNREHEDELWCAVPADHALPSFLMSGSWHFSGLGRGGDDAPPGFNNAAAALAEDLNGFYLFQIIGSAPIHALPG